MSSVTSRTKDPASIVHHTKAEICFRVDEVEPCLERLPPVNARFQFKKKLRRPLLVFAHDEVSDGVSENATIEHSLGSGLIL